MKSQNEIIQSTDLPFHNFPNHRTMRNEFVMSVIVEYFSLPIFLLHSTSYSRAILKIQIRLFLTVTKQNKWFLIRGIETINIHPLNSAIILLYRLPPCRLKFRIDIQFIYICVFYKNIINYSLHIYLYSEPYIMIKRSIQIIPVRCIYSGYFWFISA